MGCSSETKLNQIFYIDKNDEYEQISTFSHEQHLLCKKLFNCPFVEDIVDVYNTSELLLKHNITNIDFLSIDTEAYDSNVILGLNFDKITINLICVENINETAVNVLKNNNYEICYKTDNTFFKKNR